MGEGEHDRAVTQRVIEPDGSTTQFFLHPRFTAGHLSDFPEWVRLLAGKSSMTISHFGDGMAAVKLALSMSSQGGFTSTALSKTRDGGDISEAIREAYRRLAGIIRENL